MAADQDLGGVFKDETLVILLSVLGLGHPQLRGVLDDVSLHGSLHRPLHPVRALLPDRVRAHGALRDLRGPCGDIRAVVVRPAEPKLLDISVQKNLIDSIAVEEAKPLLGGRGPAQSDPGVREQHVVLDPAGESSPHDPQQVGADGQRLQLLLRNGGFFFGQHGAADDQL